MVGYANNLHAGAMKILYGISPATSGNAWIFGCSVRQNMSAIRNFLGVCQQFDVLFQDMTAIEHMELFCSLKGIPSAESTGAMEGRLKQVKLWNVRNALISTYSGGMKRRLSVILSTLGDPKCVFLDEPTTGMDPVNRRHIWSFLEKFKVGRSIVLTTHSMEEADVLADKIAIMKKGRLIAVGKSQHLKNQFGSGYRISMIVSSSHSAEELKTEIASRCEITLQEEEIIGSAMAGGNTGSQAMRLVYSADTLAKVKPLVAFLESESKATTERVTGWGINQASLEDVVIVNF